MVSDLSSSYLQDNTNLFVGDARANHNLHALVPGAHATTNEEKAALLARFYTATNEQERERALDALTRAAFPMLLHLTKKTWRLFPPAWEMADVLQEATVFLIETLSHVSPEKKISFSYLYVCAYHHLV